jgi:hypothetical protein
MRCTESMALLQFQERRNQTSALFHPIVLRFLGLSAEKLGCWKIERREIVDWTGSSQVTITSCAVLHHENISNFEIWASSDDSHSPNCGTRWIS